MSNIYIGNDGSIVKEINVVKQGVGSGRKPKGDVSEKENKETPSLAAQWNSARQDSQNAMINRMNAEKEHNENARKLDYNHPTVVASRKALANAEKKERQLGDKATDLYKKFKADEAQIAKAPDEKLHPSEQRFEDSKRGLMDSKEKLQKLSALHSQAVMDFSNNPDDSSKYHAIYEHQGNLHKAIGEHLDKLNRHEQIYGKFK